MECRCTRDSVVFGARLGQHLYVDPAIRLQGYGLSMLRGHGRVYLSRSVLLLYTQKKKHSDSSSTLSSHSIVEGVVCVCGGGILNYDIMSWEPRRFLQVPLC